MYLESAFVSPIYNPDVRTSAPLTVTQDRMGWVEAEKYSRSISSAAKKEIRMGRTKDKVYAWHFGAITLAGV